MQIRNRRLVNNNKYDAFHEMGGKVGGAMYA